ncbi:hypothetical protein [Sulfurimonas sp.]|uniref:hypothetical protein n=1 Tax=Sulfurimonas sp. TaxID=2022749 RepID=UPI0025F5F59E|nr:hypothetical protein [Sulfurimonas sp.]MBW6487522.1 hypothetical protein [Sulfurimonas sp.]
MKKIIVGTLISGCMLLASDKAVKFESKLFDLNKVKSEEMRGFLAGFENLLPSAAKVVKDYYEAKTCNKEFYNEITMYDVQEFASSSPTYGVLIALSTLNSDKKEDARDNGYNELINTYNFVNCGKGALPSPERYGLK